MRPSSPVHPGPRGTGTAGIWNEILTVAYLKRDDNRSMLRYDGTHKGLLPAVGMIIRHGATVSRMTGILVASGQGAGWCSLFEYSAQPARRNGTGTADAARRFREKHGTWED